MPIPNFNDHGLLPEGLHDCTWSELEQRFCRFQTSDRRPDLCRRLQQLLEELRHAGICREVFINGSFVTAKATPNDVDLILVLPAAWDLAADIGPNHYNLLSKKRVRKRFAFDILVACENTPEFAEYLDLFQRVRYEERRRKGVLRIRL